MDVAVAERRTRAGVLLARVFAIFALAVAGQFWAAAPSHAAGGACPRGTGVTVVVQWQSSIQTRCVPGGQSSALAALMAAGFTLTMAAREPGFLCRIDGNPGESVDRCVMASPADAYWSFWHAPAGGAWAYSDTGVASYVPPIGSDIGFRWGAGTAPSIGAPAGSAPPSSSHPTSQQPSPKPSSSSTPKPSPTPRHTSARPSSTSGAGGSRLGSTSAPRGSSNSTSAGRATGVPNSATSSGSASSSAAAGSGPTTSVPTSAPSSSAGAGSVAGSVEAGAARSAVDTGTASTGSPIGIIVGAGVLVVLAGAAVLVRKRLQ